jgi:hypothetical protein
MAVVLDLMQRVGAGPDSVAQLGMQGLEKVLARGGTIIGVQARKQKWKGT